MVGHTSAFFLFPAPAGPGFPYSPYSGRKSRARVRVLLDRADHCGQVDVQHVAARGRKAGAMCVERLQPLLASCSNALDWLRLSLAPQQRSAQDSCTAIVRNRRRAACGGRASIGAQRHICWAIAWAHHAATLRESACDRVLASISASRLFVRAHCGPAPLRVLLLTYYIVVVVSSK